jgi:hypothetical protein
MCCTVLALLTVHSILLLETAFEIFLQKNGKEEKKKWFALYRNV